ncbi:PCI domain-containing protein [Mycena venus]|uniref:PCI domain-containing protein n=1 Tax=Mycena venus TaxID=2733690 RepID=A0A8H6XHA2_9AGAR|nr:PCI domain-containing protein [Mycena venus]
MAGPSETATSSTTADATTVDGLVSALTPDVRERLDILTRVADLLGIDDLSFSSYASAITRISAREQEAQQSMNRLTLVERDLQRHLAAVGHEERLLESWIERLDTEHTQSESTATIQTRREALLKKAKEYRALLDAIVLDHPTITFADLTAQQTANEQRVQSIKAKRAQVKAFRGLPPNLPLARAQLKSARAAQMELIQLRERLLGRMAESVV